MIFVVNDMHGNKSVLLLVADFIREQMASGDILVVNGDGAGARGPFMNAVTAAYYKVKRREVDMSVLRGAVKAAAGMELDFPEEWVFGSVHGGVFRKLMADRYSAFNDAMRSELDVVIQETLYILSSAAHERDAKIVYLPGNGEITPFDFDVSDMKVEKAVEPKRRYYQSLSRKGTFRRYGIEYVPYAKRIGDILLLSTDLLDLPIAETDERLAKIGADAVAISTVIAHYPSSIEAVGDAFPFWRPNNVDRRRAETLRAIMGRLKLSDNARLFFGHIHPGLDDERLKSYAKQMQFPLCSVASGCSIWVKPGVVTPICENAYHEGLSD